MKKVILLVAIIFIAQNSIMFADPIEQSTNLDISYLNLYDNWQMHSNGINVGLEHKFYIFDAVALSLKGEMYFPINQMNGYTLSVPGLTSVLAGITLVNPNVFSLGLFFDIGVYIGYTYAHLNMFYNGDFAMWYEPSYYSGGGITSDIKLSILDIIGDKLTLGCDVGYKLFYIPEFTTDNSYSISLIHGLYIGLDISYYW